MSYLIWPQHQILAASHKAELPYSTRIFCKIKQCRDRYDGFWMRVSSELGLVALTCASLIEGVVRLVFATIAVLFFPKEKKHWITAYEFTLITFMHCLTATAVNLFVSKITPTILKTDVCLRPDQRINMLFDACKHGHRGLTKILLDREVDPHMKFEGVSATLRAHMNGHKNLHDILPLNSYEQKFLELKQLSHWLNIAGHVTVDGQTFDLEGTHSKWMFKALANALRDFQTQEEFKHTQLSQKSAQTLQEALLHAFYAHDPKQIAKRLLSKKLTFLDTGWKGHSICLCFYKGKNGEGYMGAGNRGEGADFHTTIEIYKIDPSLISEDLVNEILMHRNLSKEEGIKYFYETLPAKLSKTKTAVQDELCNQILPISPKWAKSGNCALTSKKAVLRFAWALLLKKRVNAASLERAKYGTKVFTDYAGTSYCKTICPKKKFQGIYFSDSSNNKINLAKFAKEKCTKKKGRYQKYTRLLNSNKIS